MDSLLVNQDTTTSTTRHFRKDRFYRCIKTCLIVLLVVFIYIVIPFLIGPKIVALFNNNEYGILISSMIGFFFMIAATLLLLILFVLTIVISSYAHNTYNYVYPKIDDGSDRQILWHRLGLTLLCLLIWLSGIIIIITLPFFIGPLVFGLKWSESNPGDRFISWLGGLGCFLVGGGSVIMIFIFIVCMKKKVIEWYNYLFEQKTQILPESGDV